jgi:CHRD domain/PEP-CTERM motif
MKTTFLATASLVVTIFCAMPAHATLWSFDPIALDGLQETPPVATPGFGSGTATLDDVTGEMIVSGSYQDLIGTTNDAHVHCCAAAGTPAGVLFPVTFTPSTSGTFGGSSFLSPANVTNVLNGLSYVNIHTTFRPGGEIRGQILNPVPEPATCVMLASGALGLLALRRRVR